jgi:predicted nuclease of predicted toxin-antitoxin system
VRFVADESCDFAVVRALRASGHDVVAIAEISPRLSDQKVLALAHDEMRVLVTENKDFGELVYASKLRTSGVVLLRFAADARSAMAEATNGAVDSLGDKLLRRFTVIEPGRIRVGRT